MQQPFKCRFSSSEINEKVFKRTCKFGDLYLSPFYCTYIGSMVHVTALTYFQEVEFKQQEIFYFCQCNKPSSGTCGIVACGDSGLAGATILQVPLEQVFCTGYVWLLPADRAGVMKIVGHYSVD